MVVGTHNTVQQVLCVIEHEWIIRSHQNTLAIWKWATMDCNEGYQLLTNFSRY